MIIKCINCDKKFNVNSELIPLGGRTIQCGSCNHIWFFKRENIQQKKTEILEKKTSSPALEEKKRIIKTATKDSSKKNIQKGSEIVRYKPNKKFTFSKFLSYIIVVIISFVALILIVDTFKTYLYDFFS